MSRSEAVRAHSWAHKAHAFEILGLSYDYQPDSIRTILKRAGFSLQSDEVPEEYLSQHRT